MAGIDPALPPEPAARCPWCSTPLPSGAEHCPSCNAALVDRAGPMEIPGVTGVDRGVIANEAAARVALQRAKMQNATTSYGPGRMIGRIAGGSLGAIVGAAINSAVAQKFTADAAYPWPASPPPPADPLDVETLGEAAEEPPAPGQLADPWVDLPPPSIEDQIAGTDFDPWAARDQSGDGRFDPWAVPDAPAATSTTTPDPWATGGGPWSQDAWSQPDGGSNGGSTDPQSPNERR